MCDINLHVNGEARRKTFTWECREVLCSQKEKEIIKEGTFCRSPIFVKDRNCGRLFLVSSRFLIGHSSHERDGCYREVEQAPRP